MSDYMSLYDTFGIPLGVLREGYLDDGLFFLEYRLYGEGDGVLVFKAEGGDRFTVSEPMVFQGDGEGESVIRATDMYVDPGTHRIYLRTNIVDIDDISDAPYSTSEEDEYASYVYRSYNGRFYTRYAMTTTDNRYSGMVASDVDGDIYQSNVVLSHPLPNGSMVVLDRILYIDTHTYWVGDRKIGAPGRVSLISEDALGHVANKVKADDVAVLFTPRVGEYEHGPTHFDFCTDEPCDVCNSRREENWSNGGPRFNPDDESSGGTDDELSWLAAASMEEE